jgi:NACalpha-BTF3-like transcription factor
MDTEVLEALKEVLTRLHDNGVYAFNRAKAVEIVLHKHPELWQEYQDALRQVQMQDVHQDFSTLLDRIQ